MSKKLLIIIIIFFLSSLTGKQSAEDVVESRKREKRAPADVTHSITCDASRNLQIVVQHADAMSGIDQVLEVICSYGQWRHQGGMGAFPPLSEDLPHFPPVGRKNSQNQPFLVNFWIFAPSETHFAPSMPPNIWCRHWSWFFHA